MTEKRKVLIVSCRFDENRKGGARPWFIPQAMAAPYLAGNFNPQLCTIRLFSEQYSGPLHDQKLLAWPDMLVLSGLQVDFDRFLHLTAYARTLNPKVIVVAGGSIVELLPQYSRQFFDYCCTGPVETIQEVIAEAFGQAYVADVYRVRHDLAYWNKILGYVESSRGCNFACSFCTLSIRRNGYAHYEQSAIRREILNGGSKWFFFLDNNFYGNDRAAFKAKMHLLKEMKEHNEIQAWAAEVTSDFFLKDANLAMAKAAGCSALFSGVESFDADSLLSFNKRQNLVEDQTTLIRRCLDAGILFLYGLIFDVTQRTQASIEAELDFILANPAIPLPSFFTLPIPFLGTPYFFQQLDKEAFLPNTYVRDLESTTLSMRPREGIEHFTRVWPRLVRLHHRRRAVVRHQMRFQRRYRHVLNAWQRLISLTGAGMFLKPKYGNRRRTFVSTTEILDPQYQPRMHLEAKYASYFVPTVLIDKQGQFNPALSEIHRFKQRTTSQATADATGAHASGR